MIKTSIGDLTEKDLIKKANEGTLPENLIITGTLYIEECPYLKALPKGLQVRDSLVLTGCTSIESLPKGLQVDGSLDLTGCTSLTALPKGLNLRGYLFLQGCTSLTALPSDIQVKWKIYADESFIQNYPFKEIPKILHLPFEDDQKQLLLERIQ
jgi:hypothetical protein